MAASPGAKGGMRMLPTLRLLLSNLGMLVLPKYYGLAHAKEAFDDEGKLVDSNIEAIVKGLGQQVTKMVTALRTGD
jgi:NAD(P)H-dependent FMN reductase